MLDANLHGREAPKHKSIKVEANLLAQRLEESARRGASHRRLVALTLLVALASVLLGQLFYGQWDQSLERRKALVAEAAALSKQAEAFERQRQAAVPRLEQDRMYGEARGNARRFLGEIAAVLNGGTERTALTSVRAQVLGGEMRLTVRADAEDFEALQEFAARASKGDGVLDALVLTTKRVELGGREAVAFDFAKRLKVEP